MIVAFKTLGIFDCAVKDQTHRNGIITFTMTGYENKKFMIFLPWFPHCRLKNSRASRFETAALQRRALCGMLCCERLFHLNAFEPELQAASYIMIGLGLKEHATQ